MLFTDQEFADLSRRVAAPEVSDAQNSKSIEFIASTLGGMKAVQDNHTKRLDRIEADVRDLKADRLEVKADIKGFGPTCLERSSRPSAKLVNGQ